MNIELAIKAIRLFADALEADPEPSANADARLTLAEAAASIGATTKQLRRAISGGRLLAERAGRCLVVTRRDLDAFALSRRVQPRPPAPTAPTAAGENIAGAVSDYLDRQLDQGRLQLLPGGRKS